MSIIFLIEKLKTAYNLPSDYAAAKKLGITKQSISKIRNNDSTFDDKTSFTIAELLNMNPAQVVALMNLERAKKQNKQELISFWSNYANRNF